MQLTLYTSPGCHLCENMKALLSRIKRRQAFELTEIDISASPALQRLYQNDIPVLLLENQQFVKTRAFEDPVYVGDPINVLSIFNEFVVDEIIILDIVAAHTRNTPCFQMLRKYAEECFIPLAYGGGLTEVDQFSELYHAGYEKAVVNTLLAEDPVVVEEAATRFGSQAVVASIDVRRVDGGFEVVVKGNRAVIGRPPENVKALF